MNTYSMRRIFGVLILLGSILAGGCSAMDEPVPVNTLEKLGGEWQQVDGAARVHFYPDESVKLDMPDETPPLKILTTLEPMKDNQVGFSIGDRWTAPIQVKPAADWQSIELVFPGKDERSIRFIRPKS